MKIRHPLLSVIVRGSALLLPCGCATVNPEPDCGTVMEHIGEATGQRSAYRPDQEDAIRSHVESLLSDGLTADEAVQVCLLNNPELQAAWMEIGMARADLVQSGMLSNPTLAGSLRLPAGGGLANLEVTMAQNIADLWQIPVRQRAAQAALDRAILRLARQAADLAADARAAYVRAVGARELHVVAQDNLVIARQLLNLTIGRQQVGAGSELDANLSRGAVLEAELSVESARLAASEARRSLARVLGLGLDAETILLSDPLPSSLPSPPPAETMIAIALERRLDIRAAAQAVAQADAREREEILKVFPTVEIGPAMERAERKTQPGRDAPADTDFIIGPSWGLELPLFHQNQAAIARARNARQQAEKMGEQVRIASMQEVRSAGDRMTTAWRIVRAYREQFVPLAQRNLDLAQQSYKAGRASFPSVLESQRFFLETRRRLIEAMLAAAETVPELERAVGVPFRVLADSDKMPVSSQPTVQEPGGDAR